MLYKNTAQALRICLSFDNFIFTIFNRYMQSLSHFFSNLFDTSDWPPRWHCGHWSQFHGWLYIISDLLIWAAYYTIPLLIIRVVTKKQKAKFAKMYWLFAAFILACGFTHLLDAVAFWYPVYRLTALAKCATAIVSWITVFSLIKLLPQFVNLKTSEELETEIEHRKKLEEELIAKNELLIDAEVIAKIGHWQWDITTNTVTASANFFDIYEVPFVETANRGAMHPYIHKEDIAFVKEKGLKALETKEYEDFFYRIITPSGKQKIINAKGIVKVNSLNKATYILGTIQDVTQQKETENELLEKSQALESMNVDLQRFASVASHDLQEPLRKITTFITLVQKQYGPAIDAKGQELLNKTVSATTRMQNLIESILEFSSLPTQEINFTRINVAETVQQVLTDIELSIKEKQAKITLNNLPVIEANGNQLQQLFQNLIGNAIKFSRFNTVPEVTVTVEKITGSNIKQEILTGEFKDEIFYRITVIDNGIGFEEEYMERIFLPFQRLHTRSEFEGTGIGLAICKKIVENHHGFIQVKSIVGLGSSFIITLPESQQHFKR